MFGDLCQVLKDGLLDVEVGLGRRELKDLKELAQD